MDVMNFEDLCFNTNCTSNATFQCMRCFHLFCGKCTNKIEYILICHRCLTFIVRQAVAVPMPDRADI